MFSSVDLYINAIIITKITSDTSVGEALASRVSQAMFIFLRFVEKHYDFNIDDPVPETDPIYGKDNTGTHVIFNAAQHDPSFHMKTGKYDVVTDGNYQTSRKVNDVEAKMLKTSSTLNFRFQGFEALRPNSNDEV